MRLARSAILVALVVASAREAVGGFKLTSPAFAHGQPIRRKYTCDRADISPPLRWQGSPAGVQSFAIIMEDPEVGIGSQARWVVYDLPAASRGVPQALPADERLPNGAKNGLNDLGQAGYAGPCPERGRPHHYYFRVYALDRPTGLGLRATKAEVFRAIRRHVLMVAELLATHDR